MTLNLTLLSRWGIHQSSDFRLIDADNKSIVSDHSPKILQVSYFDWLGNITYCGIGRWRGADTSQWLKEWLKHDFGETRLFNEIVDIIADKGTQWLHDIDHFRKELIPHTFVVTSFIDNRPKIALISNNQRLDSPDPLPAHKDLFITTASIHKRRLVITGLPSSVTPKDKALLESFGRDSVDTYQVHRVLHDVNLRAANNPASNSAISESCWVYSTLPDGSSQSKLYGDVEGEVVPIILFQGMDMFDQIKLNPAPGRQIQMTGANFVTSQSLNKKKHIP
jgi:hypothetical protein